MKIKRGLIKVVWKDGNYKWYKLKRRTLRTLIDNFKNLSNFSYAKVYEMDQSDENKTLVFSFGYNKQNGNYYEL